MELTISHRIEIPLTPTRRDMSMKEFDDMMWNLARTLDCDKFERTDPMYEAYMMSFRLDPCRRCVLHVSADPDEQEEENRISIRFEITSERDFLCKETPDQLNAKCDATKAEMELKVREFFSQNL